MQSHKLWVGTPGCGEAVPDVVAALRALELPARPARLHEELERRFLGREPIHELEERAGETGT